MGNYQNLRLDHSLAYCSNGLFLMTRSSISAIRRWSCEEPVILSMGAPRNHNCAKTYHQLRTNSFDKADGCWRSVRFSSDQRRGTESDQKASFLDCAKTIPLSGWRTLPFILCFSGLKGQGQANNSERLFERSLQAPSKLVRHTRHPLGFSQAKKAKATDD